MNIIQLISHAKGEKPETIVEGECQGIAMRKPGTPVHIMIDEDDPHCAYCGRLATVWVGSSERWEAHPENCSVLLTAP